MRFFRRTPGESKLRFKEVLRQLVRLKGKAYPERPKTNKGIQNTLNNEQIYADYGRTMNKYDAFYTGSVVKAEHSFHVFASQTTIRTIKEHIPPNRRFYLMDGTFKIVPRLCSQLLIISIEYKNDVRFCYNL